MTNAEALLRKGKRVAAAYVQAECCMANRNPETLNALLDHLLHPNKNIDDPDTLDWCRWLVGGGRTYEDFSSNVREFDYTEKCGLVWTADFVAFRCRTCGISQCMSLCADCFQKGNHDGHDFNMFKSQAGGACDCGDSSVMRPSGFCRKHHGPNATDGPISPPDDLMCVASNMLPRIILRLLQHLRVNTIPSVRKVSPAEALSKYERTIENAKGFLVLLHDFSSLGAAMRTVMTKCLIDKNAYETLTRVENDSEYANFMRRSQQLYEDALKSLPVFQPDAPKELLDSVLSDQLQHRTFLEELVFWTVKYEFPELLNCLLLKMLPDTTYKEAFTRSFVLHYSRVSLTLVKSSNSDRLSNRVVHVSVQLFSNEKLALSMTEHFRLLHIMVSSLVYNMMSKVLIRCRLHNSGNNHMVVDCSNHVMKDHCYWPLVSDLSNVLSHHPIALKFMSDNCLLSMWFGFLQMLQGMNVNERELEVHIEFEPTTYYASFSAELEASASPMWALVTHLKDESTGDFTANVIKHCISALKDWFKANNFTSPDQCDLFKVSFHIPLHRYFSVFLRQGVKYHGFSLKELLPDQEMLSLMMAHPLRVQTAFYEIMCGIWVRNGLQIKGQAMTYLQCHFCKSMVDADIFLLQICATQLPPVTFLSMVLERFQMDDWLTLSPNYKSSRLRIDKEQVVPMLESCLTFLVSILVLRTNLGLNETELAKLEMVTLLCMGDKQHSKLFDYMPEKSANPIQIELFDQVLSEVGQYREPQFEAGGNMQQGIYLPKPAVWEELYDPIYVLLRAVHRRDFQSSIDRFNEFARIRFANDPNRSETITNPWPPWRLPSPCDEGFEDPRRLLHSRFAHGLIFNILYKAIHGTEIPISEHIISLAVFLLELSLTFPQKEFSGKEVAISKPWLMVHEPIDLKYDTWFPTDWLSANLRHVVTAIFTHPCDNSSSDILPTNSQELTPSTQMEVDNLSNDDDDEDADEEDDDDDLPYQVETPGSSLVTPLDEPVSPFVLPSHMLSFTGPSLAITGPSYSGGTEIMLSDVNRSGNSPIPELPDGESSSRSVASVNESIISLLLKLHSKLSKRPDSYILITERTGFSTTPEYRNSRIGNGCFFVEKVLDRIVEMDEMCCQAVRHSRTQIWPSYHNVEAAHEQNQERQEAERRRKKAKERQKQMMEQLAAQQQRFMANVMETEDYQSSSVEEDVRTDGATASTSASSSSDPLTMKKREYDCVHCHLTTPSTEEKPVGLVVLLQSTSVLSHRHRESTSLVLPTSAEEEPHLAYDSLGAEFEERFQELANNFHPQSYLLAVNRGWEGGVHIQSCGHHVHLSCRQSYMEHLRSQQRSGHLQTLAVEHGEYMCPMCRQLANSVLPVPPDSENGPVTTMNSPSGLSALVKSAQHILTLCSEESLIRLRMDHLGGGTAGTASSNYQSPLRQTMSQLMEHFTKATLPQYRLEGSEYPTYVIVLFVNSIARVNLELDLVQRGGSLVSNNIDAQSPTGGVNRPKTCFVPLLHVLAIHMKVMCPRTFAREWFSLTGLDSGDERNLAVRENTVPLLLQDCITLFLHFILLLPIQLDINSFETLTKALYNLHLIQSLSRLTCGLSDKERDLLKSLAKKDLKTLPEYLGHVIECLESGPLYPPELNFGEMEVEVPDLEISVQELALPYLRIVSLIRHYVYSESLPEITDPSMEFECLVKFLSLHDSSKGPASSSVNGFNWFHSFRIADWCSEFSAFSVKCLTSARQLLQVNTLWSQPQLLKLPKNYDAIFQFYHKKACGVCKQVPKDPSVCLLCGVLVCLKESCCRYVGTSSSSGICEAVRHSLDCGAGTAMFLAVNSSTIVVVRGKRACIWGSIYLDSFGEEDKELKRGKPLFLNEERYNLLQQQWVTHRFNHTNRNWIWHRDQL